MTISEPRWIQRLRNFEKALSQLADGVEISRRRALNDLEKQGPIQTFEFTHELAWNLIRDYFRHQGNTSITGSRPPAPPPAASAFNPGNVKIRQPHPPFRETRDYIVRINRYFDHYDEKPETGNLLPPRGRHSIGCPGYCKGLGTVLYSRVKCGR